MSITDNNDYTKSKPLKGNIELINKLFEKGHYIIIFTARGSVTKIDWEKLTVKQLSDAGLKYHELKFGKPAADYYIDDKSIDIQQLLKNIDSGLL
jgi:CMP-N,N'-diacetyllegionaminic acid synthase